MTLFNSLIKTNSSRNSSTIKNDGKSSRRSSNDSTVPSSISVPSRRSSLADSLPDTSESHHYPLDNESFDMLSPAMPRRSSGPGPNVVDQGKFRKQSNCQKPITEALPVPPMTREDSWGCLSIENV